MKRSALALAALVLTLIVVIASGAFAEDPHVERPRAGAPEITTDRPAPPGVDAYERALGYVDATRVGAYIEAVAENDRVLVAMGTVRDNIEAYIVAVTPPPPPPPPTEPTYVSPSYQQATGTGGCASGGGSLDAVPAYVVQRESGGNYCAANPSGACGAYQIMPETWAGFGGYASACDAPPAVQDEKARTMAPCNWNPPNYCA